MKDHTADMLKRIRLAAFALTVMMWLGHGRAQTLPPQLCENLCGPSADCTTVCYADQMEFDNGNPTTCYVYGDYDTDISCCGDGICDVTDEMGVCNSDCSPLIEGCGECDPTTASPCGTGYACNAAHCCQAVPNCTGASNSSCQNNVKPTAPCYDAYCYQSSDCCPGDHCSVNFPRLDWLHGNEQGICVPSGYGTHSPKELGRK
jgi:hypothetical protein